MRQRYVAGNWKMNLLGKDAESLAEGLVSSLKDSDAKIMIAPSFTILSRIFKIVSGSNIILGAQNCAQETHGAYTGEVSVEMLQDVGVGTVILGHSERRIVYGENDVLINKKVKLVLKSGLELILCVGETLEQRELGQVEQVVDKQLVGGLDGVSADYLKKVTIAYEPVWAIGTGKTATASDANEIHSLIRNRIKELYGEESSKNLIIQYGGSVKPSNAAELLACEHIDGALVGGASLDLDSFTNIVLAK